jgi:hypothetical protein
MLRLVAGPLGSWKALTVRPCPSKLRPLRSVTVQLRDLADPSSLGPFSYGVFHGFAPNTCQKIDRFAGSELDVGDTEVVILSVCIITAAVALP